MPGAQELQIDLRRRFVAQAQQRRPRLLQNLRQLGAVGPITRPLPPGSQQAVVKVGVTHATTTGKHLVYLQHGKGREGQDAALFGLGAQDRQQFARQARDDHHQFRLIVSTPEHARLDRTSFIEQFMAQVEQDLQRPLIWVASHHYDTAHPHTHIVLRGVDTQGKDLYMAKHYLTHGLRDRTSQLLTWLLGPVQQQAQQQTQQTERHVFNGVVRGLEDPDVRGRMPRAPQHTPLEGTARHPPGVGRSYGYDGPDDVRMPRELGPGPGSLATARADVRLEATREHAERASGDDGQTHRLARPQPSHATPELRTDTRSLTDRLDALRQQHAQQHQQGQGRGW